MRDTRTHGLQPQLCSGAALPSSSQQVQIVKLSADFREASRVCAVPLPNTPPAGTVTVQVLWAGVNASDVNFRCALLRMARPSSLLASPQSVWAFATVVLTG